MKKTLVALAALASVAAFAQSSVSVYGSVGAGYRSQSNADTKGNKVNYMVSDSIISNKIGFQGMEDLGGGTYSKWRLESNLDASNGTEGGFYSGSNSFRIFDRESWIQLGNSSGSLTAGRQYHPTFQAYCMVSTTYCMGAGYYNTTAALDQGVNTIGKRWDGMWNLNVIATPTLQANIAMATGAGVAADPGNQATPGNSDSGKGSGFNVIWKPVAAATVVYANQTAYNTNNTNNLTSAAVPIGAPAAIAATANAAPTTVLGDNTVQPKKFTTQVFGGRYVMGDYTFSASQNSRKSDYDNNPKLTNTNLGVKYITGAYEFNYSYSTMKQQADNGAVIDQAGLKSNIAWVQYNLSKTTSAYFVVDKLSKDAAYTGSTTNGAFGALSTGTGNGVGSNSITGLTIGMNKKF